MISMRSAGAVMIFMSSRNAATRVTTPCIADPFPNSAFGKGSATPDYIISRLH